MAAATKAHAGRQGATTLLLLTTNSACVHIYPLPAAPLALLSAATVSPTHTIIITNLQFPLIRCPSIAPTHPFTHRPRTVLRN